MKSILILIILFISLTTVAQDFSGDYTSNITSFKDEQNTNNNFKENSTFNIAVFFEDNNSGRIAVQDPRIPEKVLIYKLTGFLNKIEGNGNTVYIYKAVTAHLNNPMDTKVIFYYNENSELDLMLSDVESSQVFHNLKKE